MFGTFQEELVDVPPVFGITRPAQTWNPIRINFQHLWLLITDAWRAEKWQDKLTIWFKPTGWRPENFEERFPVKKITNVTDFEKYGNNYSSKLVYWSITQVFITLLFVSYLFKNIAAIGLPGIFVYGFFIFLTIYSYTELMDMRKMSLVWEGIRFIFSIGILWYYGDWFGLNSFLSFSNFVIIGYFSVSFSMSLYFVQIDFKKHFSTSS
jgi:hypothetical protein